MLELCTRYNDWGNEKSVGHFVHRLRQSAVAMADVPGGGDSTSPLDLVSFVKAKTKKLRSSGTLVPSSEEVLGKGGAESKMLQGTDGKSKIRKSGEATGKHTTRKANVTWHYLTPTGTLAPRWGHSAAIIGSKLYIMGGTGNKVYGEMYTFDLGNLSLKRF